MPVPSAAQLPDDGFDIRDNLKSHWLLVKMMVCGGTAAQSLSSNTPEIMMLASRPRELLDRLKRFAEAGHVSIDILGKPSSVTVETELWL